jgi:hypothetical protein
MVPAPQERTVSKAMSSGDKIAPAADGRVSRMEAGRPQGKPRGGAKTASVNAALAKKTTPAGSILTRAGFPRSLNKALAAITPLAARSGLNGDINVINKQPVPKVSEILPDDTSDEKMFTEKEVLPVPPARKPGTPEPVFSNIDPNNLIPTDLKLVAIQYLNANKAKFGNLSYVGIVDFSKHSSLPRFYIADLTRGTVRIIHVAHGSGSDPDGDGYPTRFSNVHDTHASSLGFYMTGARMSANNGRAMRLHGLSSTNSNVYSRGIIIHPADYVSDRPNAKAGRSWGCLAVSNASILTVLDSLKGGALIYVWMSGVK